MYKKVDEWYKIKRKLAIVGYDPGLTSSIAITDFNGSIIKTFSRKSARIGELVDLTQKSCTPVVIACDVNPAPSSVRRFCSKFNAVLFVPDASLKVSDKIELTRGKRFRGYHERDALAAAISAYKYYKSLLEKIKRKHGEGFEEIAESIIRREATNIIEAEKLSLGRG